MQRQQSALGAAKEDETGGGKRGKRWELGRKASRSNTRRHHLTSTAASQHTAQATWPGELSQQPIIRSLLIQCKAALQRCKHHQLLHHPGRVELLQLVKQQRLCLNLSRACFRRNSTGLKCSFYTCFSFSQKLINYSAENQKVNVFMTVNVLSMSWCKPLHQLILTVLMKEEIIYGDQTVSVHMGLTHHCLCWTVVELYISQ